LGASFREASALLLALASLLALSLLQLFSGSYPPILDYTLTASAAFLFGHVIGRNGSSGAIPRIPPP